MSNVVYDPVKALFTCLLFSQWLDIIYYTTGDNSDSFKSLFITSCNVLLYT
jgi:hypothetical protein